MNENAKKWVEALRSGEYEQGQRALRRGNRFCCLGVACELAAEKGIVGHARPVVNAATYTYDGIANVLPEPVADWLGLQTTAGEWNAQPDEDSDGCALTSQNDAGLSFTEIADLIESEPRGLFA